MIKWIAAAGLVGVASILLIFWATQQELIYMPSPDVGEPSAAGVPAAERVALSTRDGLRLHGWFVPPSAPARGGVVIVFNGNAGNRAHRADLARGLRRARSGDAAGRLPRLWRQSGLAVRRGARPRRDRRARYVDSRRDVDRQRIVYFGESLGSGVAVRLALTHPPAALVLRSPFTSLADAARYHFPYLPVGLLLRDRYASATRSLASVVQWW